MHGLSETVSICGFLWGCWELSVKQPCKSALSVGDGVHGHGGCWGKKGLIGQFSTEGPWQIYPDGVGSVGVSDSVQCLSKQDKAARWGCNEPSCFAPLAETGCPQQSQFKWALPCYGKKGLSISSHTYMMAIELYFIPLLWYLCDLMLYNQSSTRAERRLNSTLLMLSTLLQFDFLIYL